MKKFLAGVVAAVGLVVGVASPAAAASPSAGISVYNPPSASTSYVGLGQYIKTIQPAPYYAYQTVYYAAGYYNHFTLIDNGAGEFVMAAMTTAVSCTAATGATCSGNELVMPYNYEAGHAYYLYTVRSASSSTAWEFWIMHVETGVWSGVGSINTNSTAGVTGDSHVNTSPLPHGVSTCAGWGRTEAAYYLPQYVTARFSAAVSGSHLGTGQATSTGCPMSFNTTSYPGWAVHALNI